MPDLRPGNRGIGVSVAVGTRSADGEIDLLRETISPLRAEDALLCAEAMLDTGSLLSDCRVLRNSTQETSSGGETYVVEFESSGRHYRCPLYRFQARTHATERGCLNGMPAREAVAV